MSEPEARKRPGPSRKSNQPNKKAKLDSRKKKPGFDDEIFSETTYSIRDGLRYVKPYYFTFTTHAKGRWVGSTVYDIFCKEFQAESPKYYERAIKAGKVTVNGQAAGMGTVIGHNDLVCHLVHRHEPPVTSHPLTILHSDEDLVVINKPASIPIHPCGRYRHNSVIFLLGKEHNLRNLHTVHRLDRLTSGLLILAKSLRRAQQLEVEIRERRVSKEYLCRVQGEFPSSPVECAEPILVFSHKLGLSRVDPEGKPCTTLFTCLSYNGETSLVKCQPKTGRMHQIRVHLQWLGHPILNDPLYNHPAWRSSEGGGVDEGGGGAGRSLLSKPYLENVVSEIIHSKFAESAQRTGGMDTVVVEGRESSKVKRIEIAGDGEMIGEKMTGDDGEMKTERDWKVSKEDERTETAGDVEIEEEREGVAKMTDDEVTKNLEGEKLSEATEVEGGEKTLKTDSLIVTKEATSSYDPDCTECQLTRPPPSPDQLFMCLHALSYKGDGWSFSTPLPHWADANWKH